MSALVKKFLVILGAGFPVAVILGLFAYNNRDNHLFLYQMRNHLEAPFLYRGLLFGFLAAIVFIAGLIIVKYAPARRQWLAAAILIIVVTPLALQGFWLAPGAWGISDWDYYFSYHTDLRNMIVQQHVFPLWNPYTCGGTAGLADPEFPLFTPTFLLELMFGIPVGFKLSIFLVTAVGGLGMLALAHKLKLSMWGGLLAALGFAFSSVSLLEIVEGHPNVFSAMYLPWIFFVWLVAYRRAANQRLFRQLSWPVLILGSLLCLMFFQGGIHLLTYVGLALIFLIIAAKKRRAALSITLQSGVLALGLAAIKLIPSLLWLSQFPKEVYASPTLTLPWLDRILLGRYLHGGINIFPGQESGWHTFGAYVGPVILILAVWGLAQIRQRPVKILACGTVAAIVISSAGPILKPLFDVAVFVPRSNLPRLIIFAVLGLSLLAGYGLQQVIDKHSRRRWLPVLLLGLAAVDLMTLSSTLSMQAFVLPAVQTKDMLPPAPSPIAYSVNAHTYRYSPIPTVHNKNGEGVDYTRSYANILQGYGILSYCSVLGPPRAVNAIEESNHEFVAIDDPAGTVQLVSWTPNQIVIKAHAAITANVVINANYVKGWLVNGAPANEIDNRLGALIQPGDRELTFTYPAPGFKTGLIVSLVSILLFALGIWNNRKVRQIGA